MLLTLVLPYFCYASCRALNNLAAFSREQLFPTVGFMDSGEGYPWYGYTVGDDSRIYGDFKILTGGEKDNRCVCLLPEYVYAVVSLLRGNHRKMRVFLCPVRIMRM